MSPAPSQPFRFALEGQSDGARAGRSRRRTGRSRRPRSCRSARTAPCKAMTPEQVAATGSEIVLANTYHLALRPGEELVAKLGGLHAFMRWDGPILTDSGGFQVFSLPKQGDHRPRRALPERGRRQRRSTLTPERSMQIQHALGADIVMAFDECTPYPADERLARTGVRRTLAWLERCAKQHAGRRDQALFGIVQGSTYPHLRESCAQAVVAMDLPGYRDRRRVGRRGARAARAGDRLDRAAPARGQAPLPDGRRPARGHDRRGRARHRHVRLRDPDPLRAQRHAVHAARPHPAHQPPLPPRRLSRSTRAATAPPARPASRAPICTTCSPRTRSCRRSWPRCTTCASTSASSQMRGGRSSKAASRSSARRSWPSIEPATATRRQRARSSRASVTSITRRPARRSEQSG